MTTILLECTSEKGKEKTTDFLRFDELVAFIVLLYMWGVLSLNKSDVHDPFSQELGVAFFQEQGVKRQVPEHYGKFTR